MYYQKDLERLRKKFSGVENIKENYSQSMQDRFVLTMLNGKGMEYILRLVLINLY